MQREKPDEEAEAKERADFAALASLGRRPARQITLAASSAAPTVPTTKAEDAAQTKRKTAHAAPGARERLAPILSFGVKSPLALTADVPCW